jgi:hypothetical protein
MLQKHSNKLENLEEMDTFIMQMTYRIELSRYKPLKQIYSK